MDKLPVLFVSCDVGNIQSREQACSGPARMIRGKEYKSVVVISSSSDQKAPEILQLKGDCATAGKMRVLLSEQGFTPEISSTITPGRTRLLNALLTEETHRMTELILNTGMSEVEYRRVGLCLEVLRELDVLIICLDDKESHKEKAGISPGDRQLRELLSGWEKDQQWRAAMSFKGDSSRSQQVTRLGDPTVCLLNAAFTLGGSQFPQRMFSSGAKTSCNAVSGYCWFS